MKFTINKNTLIRPLENVAKALSSRNAVPILSEILFWLDSEGLILIAGDASISIKAHIPADQFDILQTGIVTLPGKKITEIVKKVNDDITVETNGLQAVIKSGKSKFELTGMDPAEYPNFMEVHGEVITMTGEAIKKAINKTIFATSKQENTPILTGIRFTFGDQIQLTGCDRHRLAQTHMPGESGDGLTTVISAESLNELIKIISDKDQVELIFETDRFLARTNEYTFVSRVLDGTYPDTSRLIPNQFKAEITVSTLHFIEAIERVSIIAAEEKQNLIHMSAGDEIEFSSNTSSGKVIESLDIHARTGENFTIAFNAKFALDALKAIDSEETVIHFVGNMQPIIFKGVGDENSLFLILPYRTSAN